MQIGHLKGNIIEKVLRDKEGRLVRARFCVYERNGRIKAQLLDFVYIVEQVLLGTAQFVLQGIVAAKTALSYTFKKIVSESFNTEESLYFIGSKPRAPTFA